MMKSRLSTIFFVSRGLSLLAVLSLLSHQNAWAISGQEIIKRVQAKIQNVQALTLRFSAQIQMEGDLIEEEGRIYFAQGGRFRMESSGQILICDGKTLWAYTPADSQVVVFDAGAGGPPFFTPQQLLFDYPDKYEVKSVENVRHGGMPCYLLTMTPREVTDPVASLKVWVDRKEYLTRRVEIEELTESKAGFSFEDIEIRQNLPDSTFQFAPPPSVEVIDMR